MVDVASITPQVGIYGKHPSFGDFVTAGLPDAGQNMLERWLHTVLPALRDMWGENWQTFFDAAPVINFWFGPDLTGGVGSICGMMGPSRDKVGRRFPLLAAVAGSGKMPPPVDTDQTLYAAFLQSVASYERREGTGAVDFHHILSQDMAAHITAHEDAGDPGFWAVRQDGDTARLWGDVAAADHVRGAVGRSYLWCAGAGGAAVHVSQGLPGHEEMAWLMTSAIAAPLPPAEDHNEQELPTEEAAE